jgi:hypothetical protein
MKGKNMDIHNLTEEEKEQLRKELIELVTKPYQGIRGPRKTPVSKSEYRRREEREFAKRLEEQKVRADMTLLSYEFIAKRLSEAESDLEEIEAELQQAAKSKLKGD